MEGELGAVVVLCGQDPGADSDAMGLGAKGVKPSNRVLVIGEISNSHQAKRMGLIYPHLNMIDRLLIYSTDEKAALFTEQHWDPEELQLRKAQSQPEQMTPSRQTYS